MRVIQPDIQSAIQPNREIKLVREIQTCAESGRQMTRGDSGTKKAGAEMDRQT